MFAARPAMAPTSARLPGFLLLMCLASYSECQETGLYVLQHQIATGRDFVTRGQLRMRNAGSPSLEQVVLSQKDQANFKKLVESDDLYRLRLCPVGAGDQIVESRCVATFIPACALYEARLSDTITLTLDGGEDIAAITLSVKPSIDVSSCSAGHNPGRHQAMVADHFNTKVDVVTSAAAPVPDTQTYIDKLEQEKKRKEKGEDQDNRSFFAKYWMYILPAVVILIMMSSQEQGGGGGGN